MSTKDKRLERVPVRYPATIANSGDGTEIVKYKWASEARPIRESTGQEQDYPAADNGERLQSVILLPKSRNHL